MSKTSTPYQINDIDELYYFDGPVIFVGKVGISKSLFVKYDEDDVCSKYISCHIDEKHISALRDGRISLRGIFDAQNDKYFVECDEELNIINDKYIEKDTIKEEILPKRGVGLEPEFGECPDVLEERNSLLSVYFRGESMSRDAIPYSTLMDLLGRVQTFARSVITPAALRSSRSATLDFMVGDPALGSLMISIKGPVADISRVRRNKAARNYTLQSLKEGMSHNKDAFFEGMEELLQPYHEIEDDEVYEAAHHLFPTDETPFSSVTFSTSRESNVRRVSVDRENAARVRAAFEKQDKGQVVRTGNIIEINAASRTLLLRSPSGRTTTCVFDREMFDELRREATFRIGAQMQLRGGLTERPRRDKLYVDRIEGLEPAKAQR